MGNTKIDINKVAAAIEADAGEALPDLRQAKGPRHHTRTNAGATSIECRLKPSPCRFVLDRLHLSHVHRHRLA